MKTIEVLDYPLFERASIRILVVYDPSGREVHRADGVLGKLDAVLVQKIFQLSEVSYVAVRRFDGLRREEISTPSRNTPTSLAPTLVELFAWMKEKLASI